MELTTEVNVSHEPTCPAGGTISDANVIEKNLVSMVFQLLILCALFLLSLIGNVMVLYVIGAHLKLKTATNAFIVSLSVSDLLVTLSCMPMSIVATGMGSWVFGAPGCVINATLNCAFGIISALMLTCISVDRYVIVVKLPQKSLSLKIAAAVISTCWFAAILFSLPWYLVISQSRCTLIHYQTGFHHCMYIFHAHSSNEGLVHSMLVIVIFYIVPCICIMFCSTNLYRLIRQNQSKIKPNTLQASQVRFSGELRTAKTVIIMVIVFIACRMTYPMMGIFTAILQSEFTSSMGTVGMLLSWAQCAINPVIYALRNPTVAQVLHIRHNRTTYQPEAPRISHFSEALCGLGQTGERQSKYRASEDSLAELPHGSDFCGNTSKNWRSDSIPTVMNFQSLNRKSSNFSAVTAITRASADTTM